MRRLEGFEDVTNLLRGGVYALVYRGEVVYVGKSKTMLVRIYSHRSAAGRRQPPWFPVKGIRFDEVHIQPCHPDRIDDLERRMIELYKPVYNVQLKSLGPTTAPFNLMIGDTVLAFNQPKLGLPEISRRL